MSVVVDKFNAAMEQEQRDIRAEFTLIPYEESEMKFMTALASESAPDVYGLDLILFPYFNSIGAFVDITEKVKALSYHEQFNPGMLAIGVWEGKTYAVPLYNDNSALIYNKTLFREAGIEEPPKTWDEVKLYAERLTQGDTHGITFCGSLAGMSMFTWLPHLWMNGGRIGDNARQEITLNSPAAAEALQYWADLIRFAPPGAEMFSYGEYYNSFLSGKVGMIFGGEWFIGDISNDNPSLDYDVVPFPTKALGQATSSFMGGDNIGICSQSEHVEEAWEFIKFATSEAIQRDVVAGSNTVPGRLDIALNNEYFDKDPKYYVFAKTAEVGRAPYTSFYAEETEIIGMMVAKALGGMPVQKALEEAAEQLKELYR